jgi:thiamine-monophosphate kinase
MKELKIIQSFFQRNSIPQDDCYFRDGLLYTTDSLSEKTHFFHSWSSPRDLAIKLIHVNASDILSSGGKPLFCFLNLGLSKVSSKSDWLLKFSQTLKKELKYLSIELCGGDTYASPYTNLSMTMVGACKNPISRENSQLNDNVYLTRKIGLSKLGYNLLKDKRMSRRDAILKESIKVHLQPRADFKIFPFVKDSYKINSAMDITDGLFQDAQKLSKASKLGMSIELRNLPEIDSLQKYLKIEEIVTSGEELVILFTSPEEIISEGVSKIGKMNNSKRVTLFLDGKRVTLKETGFLHFR